MDFTALRGTPNDIDPLVPFRQLGYNGHHSTFYLSQICIQMKVYTTVT